MKHLTTKTALIALASICLISFGFRALSAHNVFDHSFVSFLEGDAYDQMYQAKLIMGMLHTNVFSAIHYVVTNSLLWSGLVGTLGLVFPIEYVGAWLPAILGALVSVLVYLIGKTMFNRLVGLIAALFIGIIPSEFLHRSLVGYADHHVLEVFLMAFVILFTVKSLKEGGLRWSIFAGLSLFLYMANWTGGILLPLTLGGFVGLWAIWRIATRKKWWSDITPILVILGVGMIIYLPLGGYERYLYFLPHSGSLPVPASATGEQIATITTSANNQTISEMMPLLQPFGTFNPLVVITNLHLFVITFFLGFVLLWKFRNEPDKILLCVWAIAMTAITLTARRFLYYLELPIALLSAFAIWWLTTKLNVKETIQNAVALSSPLILFSLPLAGLMAQSPAYQMTDEWHDDLEWLKMQPPGIVTAWSDYGHWIRYETQNTPNLLPGPGGKEVAQLFLSTGSTEEQQLLDTLGTDYLIVDLSTLNQKMGALQTVSGEKIEDVRNTLIYRLLNSSSPQPYLRLIHESETIRIFQVVK